jgi:gamma-glutamyltranspeptidase / glutathione hydrolase
MIAPVPPNHLRLKCNVRPAAALLLLALGSAGCEPLPPPPSGTGSIPAAPADSTAPAPSAPPVVAQPEPGLAVPDRIRPGGLPPVGAGFPREWAYTTVGQAVPGTRGGVASTDLHASRVGLEILRSGGNAIDAAVATAFALAVVNPEAGNIGGGGFLVLRRGDGASITLDFRETAPGAASRDMFLDEAGELTERSMVGHLASGVPGTVRGLWDAHQRFGRLPWEQLLEPAIALAEGVVVSERLAGSLEAHQRALELFEATRRIFMPGGVLPAVGSTLAQPELAATLARIRDRGADGFYRGDTADLLVAEMERGGGILTREDLEGYRAVWRAPVTFTYRGHTLLSMPPSSSGGATLAAMLNILEGFDLGALGWQSPATVHLLVEAAKRAYADRNELLADPDFQDNPLERMTSREYGVARRGGIALDRATPAEEVLPGADAPPGGGVNTTHFSIVDEEGSAVALTFTLNSTFGSKVMVEGAGFLLNNQMDDFAARPGTPNQFGLVQGVRNAVEPWKRMLSAMTPTIVMDPDGDLLMVVGTPGGSTIITTVLQVISNVLDHRMDLATAVYAPRIHHQHLPDQIFFEPAGLPQQTVTALEGLGHRLVERLEMSGDVQAILVLPDGTLTAVSDPRRGGRALGY